MTPLGEAGISRYPSAMVLLIAAAVLVMAVSRPVTRHAVNGKATGLRIDLNRADAETLCLLPGIGPRLASAVVEMRRETGRFRAVEQLTSVHGIGLQTVQRLEAYAVCGAAESGFDR